MEEGIKLVFPYYAHSCICASVSPNLSGETTFEARTSDSLSTNLTVNKPVNRNSFHIPHFTITNSLLWSYCYTLRVFVVCVCTCILLLMQKTIPSFTVCPCSFKESN